MIRRILAHLRTRFRGYEWKAKTAETWESEYRAGSWEFLQDLDELAHHSVLVGYYAELSPGGSVLDVGCGYGALAERMAAYACPQYTGIDVAEMAITRALSLEIPHAEFSVASAEVYQPARSYDVIVFNECLGYFPDPLSILRHYSHYLAPEGLILISMWENGANKVIWKQIASHVSIIDRVRIENSKGTAWNVGVIPGIPT